MALFYLIRHGQTEWNLGGKMQGREDSPLTDLGKSQAHKAADETRDVSFTHCYYSPLGRTKATAEIILQNHNDITPVPNDDFLEIGFGIFEGTVNKRSDHRTVRSEHERELHNLWFAPQDYKGCPEDGEDFYQLQDRLYKSVEKLADKHDADDTVLIVSHCAAIRSVLNKCIDRDMKDFWEEPRTEPASISIIHWNKGEKPEVLRYSGHDVPETVK